MDEKYIRGYQALYERHWWWRSREALLVRETERIAAQSPTRRILDVGCGNGLFFPVLERFGDVWGVEPAVDAVPPDSRWRARIHLGPFDASYRPEAPFDLVFALDVVEHVSDPRDFLRNVRRVIAPGGWFVATVPAYRALWTRHDTLNQHVTRFGHGELEALVRAERFTIEHSRHFFVALAGAKLVVRALEAFSLGEPEPPTVPSGAINSAAIAYHRLEQTVFGRSSPGFGSSLLVVARA